MQRTENRTLGPAVPSAGRPTSYRYLIPGLFLIGRLVLIVTLPLDGLAGYGDHWNFYRLAGLGRPMVDFWVEFPPLFPWLSTGLFALAGGREHTYQYLLVLLLSLAQAANIFLFFTIAQQIHVVEKGLVRTAGYALLLVGLGYGWWYFDPLAVFFMLLAVQWLLAGQVGKTGLAIALGILVKWFPALILPAIWRWMAPKRAFLTTLTAVGITAAVWLSLLAASPDFTAASLQSQFNKGSWETVWALLDGNTGTGNFGPEVSRTDPQAAQSSDRNPAVISTWIVLLPLLGIGAWLSAKIRPERGAQLVAFVGLTWCLFLIWSPGYSPQWVLYLLPLILLVLPDRIAFLMAASLLGLNLLEWPLLLSRGWFWSLQILVPLRTLILILLGIEFWRQARPDRQATPIQSVGRNRHLGVPSERGAEG